MTEIDEKIPPKLMEIIDDFQWAEGREKLELLIQYAERMPPLPERLAAHHDEMEPVPECMTPVFVKAVTQEGKMTFFFDVPAESPTIRGYAAMLAEGLQGATPDQVLSVPEDFYQQMGLDRVLSHQRLNGILAILAHMKRLALQALSE
jgi:cysteine desulfuration protein SufE